MDVAISLGQAIGLGVAAGLAALLPLAVGAVAAVLGFTPGATSTYDDTAVVVAAWVAGVAQAASALVVPPVVRTALAAAGGGVAGYLVAWEDAPVAGVVLAAVLGAAAALVSGRLLAGALAGEGSRSGLTVIAAAAAVGLAVVAIVPFAGYVLAVALGWFGIRQRRAGQRKYAGLRVLR